MISLSASWAVVLRHLRLWKNDPNVPLFNIYWPVLDVLTWGFMGLWMQKLIPQGSGDYTTMALLALLLFQVCSRGCNAFCLALNEELWSNNIVTLFSLPIRIAEWIVGVIVLVAVNILMTATVCMGFSFALYSIPVWQTIKVFLWLAPPLFLSCMWLGFMSLAILTALGKRGVEIGFVVAWFFLPFCGAYFPVDVLPAWGQTLSTWLPMTPVFKALRLYLVTGENPTSLLIRGYAMGALYAALGVFLFVYSFNKSKERGIARLLD